MVEYVGSLRRHLDDLRLRYYEHHDTRETQEAHTETVIAWLDPIVTECMERAKAELLGDSATIAASGPLRDPSGSLWAYWDLHWPDLNEYQLGPARVALTFFPGWQHPHLHGSFPGPVKPPPELACANVWPLQVTSPEEADERRPVIESILETELHAKICGQAIAMLLAGLDANEAWKAFPAYRAAVGATTP